MDTACVRRSCPSKLIRVSLSAALGLVQRQGEVNKCDEALYGAIVALRPHSEWGHVQAGKAIEAANSIRAIFYCTQSTVHNSSSQ